MTAPPTLLALLLCAPPTGPAAPPVLPDAAAVLARWEATTAHRIRVSPADRAADRLVRPDAPQELLDLAADLRGPIDSAALRERYEWRVSGVRNGYTILRVNPRDPLARAFTPTLLAASREDVPTTAIAPDAAAPRNWATDSAHVVRLDVRASAPPPPARLVARTDYAVHANHVIRGQSPDPVPFHEPSAARRTPVKTALYVRPAGDAPTWRLDRRLKRVPVTKLAGERRPLVAPKPR